MNALSLWFNELKETFISCFITDDRWEWIAEGFVNSVIITVFALLLGLVVGIVLAAVRSSYDKNEEALKIKGGIGYYILKILNAVSKAYITVMRGAAFSAGLDMDKPPMDMIVGALHAVLTIFIFIACPPVAISNQIKKDKLIIQAADKVLSAPDQIV